MSITVAQVKLGWNASTAANILHCMESVLFRERCVLFHKNALYLMIKWLHWAHRQEVYICWGWSVRLCRDWSSPSGLLWFVTAVPWSFMYDLLWWFCCEGLSFSSETTGVVFYIFSEIPVIDAMVFPRRNGTSFLHYLHLRFLTACHVAQPSLGRGSVSMSRSKEWILTWPCVTDTKCEL